MGMSSDWTINQFTTFMSVLHRLHSQKQRRISTYTAPIDITVVSRIRRVYIAYRSVPFPDENDRSLYRYFMGKYGKPVGRCNSFASTVSEYTYLRFINASLVAHKTLDRERTVRR